MGYQVPTKKLRLWPMIARVVCVFILIGIPNLIMLPYEINQYRETIQRGASFSHYIQTEPEKLYLIPFMLLTLLFLVTIVQDIRQTLRHKQPPWDLYIIGAVIIVLGLCGYGLYAVRSITHV